MWAGETVWNEGVAYADLDSNGNPVDNAVRIRATGGGVSTYETAPEDGHREHGKRTTLARPCGFPILTFTRPQVGGHAAVKSGTHTQNLSKTGNARPLGDPAT